MNSLRRTIAALTITIGGVGAPALLLATPSSAALATTSPTSIVRSDTGALLSFTATGGTPIATTAYDALLALRSGDTARYALRLDDLAKLVDDKTGIDASQFVSQWAVTDTTRMTAMLAALTQVGSGYRYNSQLPGVSFDCSGLTSWAWAQAGVSIPHQSRAIINTIAKDTFDGASPGDVFYYPGHVMVSLGVSDAYVHAADPHRGVEVTTLNGRRKSVRVGDPIG